MGRLRNIGSRMKEEWAIADGRFEFKPPAGTETVGRGDWSRRGSCCGRQSRFLASLGMTAGPDFARNDIQSMADLTKTPQSTAE